MFKCMVIVVATIFMVGCSNKSIVQQKKWNELLDGSSFKQIGFNPTELENKINNNDNKN